MFRYCKTERVTMNDNKNERDAILAAFKSLRKRGATFEDLEQVVFDATFLLKRYEQGLDKEPKQ